jgi:hypothetical protein
MAVVSIKNKLRRGNLLVGNDAYMPPSFESIATTVVNSSGSATVVFDNIPQTFTHLQLRVLGKTDRNADLNSPYITFNTDTNLGNYFDHELYGDGATAYDSAYTNLDAGIILERFAGSGTGMTSIFGALVIDILDYTNTNKKTTTRLFSAVDANGTGQVSLVGGIWQNTAAVTKITFNQGYAATKFQQYSHFALYGIKG